MRKAFRSGRWVANRRSWLSPELALSRAVPGHRVKPRGNSEGGFEGRCVEAPAVIGLLFPAASRQPAACLVAGLPLPGEPFRIVPHYSQWGELLGSWVPRSASNIIALLLCLFGLNVCSLATQHPVPLGKNPDQAKCVECHADKSHGKYMHSAIAMGCTTCHSLTSDKDETLVNLRVKLGAYKFFDPQEGGWMSDFWLKHKPDSVANWASKGGMMQLSLKGMAIASALLWGGGILVLGLLHLASPSYGGIFLEGISSVYPGFHGARTFGDAIVGTGYALVDGGIGGYVFAWLYNLVARQ